ncbi:hypothetical protein D3C77_391570 [compost metagenome]
MSAAVLVLSSITCVTNCEADDVAALPVLARVLASATGVMRMRSPWSITVKSWASSTE